MTPLEQQARIALLTQLDKALERFKREQSTVTGRVECYEGVALPLADGKFGEAGAILRKSSEGLISARFELALEANVYAPSTVDTPQYALMRGILVELQQQLNNTTLDHPRINYVDRKFNFSSGLRSNLKPSGEFERQPGYAETDTISLGKSPKLEAVGAAIQILLDEAKRIPGTTGVSTDDNGVIFNSAAHITQVG